MTRFPSQRLAAFETLTGVKPDHDSLIDKIRSVPKLIFTDDFEITVQSSETRASSFSNGERTSASESSQTWMSLRLQHQRRPGRAATFYRGEGSLTELVELAFEASKHSSPDPWFRFPIWRSQNDQGIGKPLQPQGDFSSHFEELVWKPDSLKETYESSVVVTSIYRKSERKALKEQTGYDSLRLSAAQTLEDNSIKMSASRMAKLGKLDLERPLEELIRGIYYRKGGERYRASAEQSFILGPQVVAALLRALGPWFSAEKFSRGLSPFVDLMGEKIFSETISLVDDPRHEKAALSNRIDLEGTSTQRSVLVEKGKLAGLVYDAYHAAKENRLSTGNWYRPPKEASAHLVPWHLTLQEGSQSFEELLGSLKNGVFLDYCSQLEIDPANPTSATIVGAGWKVAAGVVEAPLWNVVLQVDVFDLLRRVSAVGKSQTFFGDCAASAILIEQLPLAH